MFSQPIVDDYREESAAAYFDYVFDKMVLSKVSQRLLSDFFRYPKGEWIDLQQFFTHHGVNYTHTQFKIFACWLNELDGSDYPYRIIVFHEYEFMQTKLATYNLNALDGFRNSD